MDSRGIVVPGRREDNKEGNRKNNRDIVVLDSRDIVILSYGEDVTKKGGLEI